MARLLSLNVGLPRDVAWQGRTVRTAIWKAPVQGRRMVRRLNVDGDGQGDLAGHGGEHRAVFVYQRESYRYWESQLGRADLTCGQFGENFTVQGLGDDQVCIGDRYRVGNAVFEVTQPRVTCYRLGIRMNEPQMPALLVSHDRPGFYFRVIAEGEVEAGDEIVRLTRGPEAMTVAEVNALLYKPGRCTDRLERALRIPALSVGWRSSFAALLEQPRNESAATGDAAGDEATGRAPAWAGFRPMRVTGKVRESNDVTSLALEPADGRPLAAGRPGQFAVLRLRPAPDASPLLRSYSLSGGPTEARYRISVKRNKGGAAGAYVADGVRVGDIVEMAAPRGSFTLQPGDGPIVLLSAGIGATPVLAMLLTLAAAKSRREIWWLHGARDREEHAFADEVRTVLKALPHAHSHIRYSAPGAGDRPGVDFDAPGRLIAPALAELGLPRDADFYLCGPAAFMADMSAGLAGWGVAAGRIHSENFGTGPSLTPGIAVAPGRRPHLPTATAGSGPLVSFARSGLNVRWDPSYQSLLELAEACDVPVRWSCRSGVCHNCETALVSGAIGYRLEPVDPPAAGNVLICCSQPQADIVIDL
ncbi:MOSC and FAD-binding oxidoreductase domain-containing protein [Chelatococcus reniformis]|uniref:Sulfurase n=1 Tax=Chelatococcus reniformis TaxID=1494448 RepID=A0A916UTA1_9HYPH|nr:MOSC and FAD-binding oxidoreductase domain-containing protein [Chelatococcus reniformis]GGC85831.1 sulfurase [Chelatococcus reniformis]